MSHRLLHARCLRPCSGTCPLAADAQASPQRRRRRTSFYEKQCPSHVPQVGRADDRRRQQPRARRQDHFRPWPTHLPDARVAGQPRRPGAAHLAGARGPLRSRPTVIAFDLDPGPCATIVECAEVALELRMIFDYVGMQAFPKTSGSKGMQVVRCRSTRRPPTRRRARSRTAWPSCWSAGDPSSSSSEMPPRSSAGQGVRRLEPECSLQDDRLACTRCSSGEADRVAPRCGGTRSRTVTRDARPRRPRVHLRRRAGAGRRAR